IDRMRSRKSGCDCGEIGLRLFKRHIGFHPCQSFETASATLAFGPLAGNGDRRPDLDPRRLQPVRNRIWHYRDDAVRLVVDPNFPSENRRIRAEAVPPETRADRRHTSFFTVFVFREKTPEDRPYAEN